MAISLSDYVVEQEDFPPYIERMSVSTFKRSIPPKPDEGREGRVRIADVLEPDDYIDDYEEQEPNVERERGERLDPRETSPRYDFLASKDNLYELMKRGIYVLDNPSSKYSDALFFAYPGEFRIEILRRERIYYQVPDFLTDESRHPMYVMVKVHPDADPRYHSYQWTERGLKSFGHFHGSAAGTCMGGDLIDFDHIISRPFDQMVEQLLDIPVLYCDKHRIVNLDSLNNGTCSTISRSGRDLKSWVETGDLPATDQERIQTDQLT